MYQASDNPPTRYMLATCDTPADLGALIYLRRIEVGNYWQAFMLGTDWAELAADYMIAERIN